MFFVGTFGISLGHIDLHASLGEHALQLLVVAELVVALRRHQDGTDAEAESEKLPTTNRNKNGIFINVKIALIALGAIAAFTVILVIIRSIISQYQFAKKRREVIRRHRERKRKGKYGE